MMLLTQVGGSEKSMETFGVSLGLLVMDLSRRTAAASQFLKCFKQASQPINQRTISPLRIKLFKEYRLCWHHLIKVCDTFPPLEVLFYNIYICICIYIILHILHVYIFSKVRHCWFRL